MRETRIFTDLDWKGLRRFMGAHQSAPTPTTRPSTRGARLVYADPGRNVVCELPSNADIRVIGLVRLEGSLAARPVDPNACRGVAR